MMRIICSGYRRFGIVAVLFLTVIVPSAQCQSDGVALLIQQAPAAGGTVTPTLGVHNFTSSEQVGLSAVAAPGYQFVYWLGDVSDPSSNSTFTVLDGPKIIIAVFEKVAFGLLPAFQQVHGAPIGGMHAGTADYASGGISPVGGKRPHKLIPPGPPPKKPEEPEDEIDFPVPGDDYVPVPEPIPEPATICLLGLGGLLFRTVRRRH